MENHPLTDCAVIVSSCDAYEDAWMPFFTLFFRYWPDYPFPVYLISNFKIYPDSRVQTIAVGEDKSWADNTRLALEHIHTPYIIIMLEDLFLNRTVDTNYVGLLLRYAQQTQAAFVGLRPPDPFPDKDFPNNLNLGEKSKNTNYRISLAASLWDVNVFKKILKNGENAWQMEINGTMRSNQVEAPFLAVKEGAINFHSNAGIVRGKWLYDSIKIFKREGIKLDLRKRSIDYERKMRSVFENLRKTSFGQRLKHIPLIGRGLASFSWWLATLKINNIFKNKK